VYSVLPSFVLGFHGCDESTAEKVFSESNRLRRSTNNWDWLGHGIYFWENNPNRARHYACELRDHPERSRTKITNPAVVGAIIDLGYCLNLLDEKSIGLVSAANELYLAGCQADSVVPLENRNVDGSSDRPLRYKDCAVVEALHAFRQGSGLKPFDSVRGMFAEGIPLYDNAGFHEKNHIQVCIRNPNCIKGYFRPLASDNEWPMP
jgi:hypothetical protein